MNIQRSANAIPEIDDDTAKKVLGIDGSDWIVTVNNEELAILKAALNTHAQMATDLAKKIENIG